MKRTDKPITPEEAASLLQSAVSYCQKAGLKVKAENTPGALLLEVPTLCYTVTGEGAVEFGVAPAVEVVNATPPTVEPQAVDAPEVAQN